MYEITPDDYERPEDVAYHWEMLQQNFTDDETKTA